MRNVTKMIMIALLSFALIGCSQSNERENTVDLTNNTNGETQKIDANKILITYFTVPETDGTDTSSSASRVATNNGVVGNTEYIANIIQENIGGDIFQIETQQTYPGTHDRLLEFARKEIDNNERPELKSEIANLDEYDTIFIGYPNWNADLPMPLYTFLEQYNFSGKTIIPFTTHGGSGFSGTIGTIADLQPNAQIASNGLSVSRGNVASSEAEVKEWIDSLNIK